MSTTPIVANPAQLQLEEALERLAAQVRLRVPGIQCRIQHGSNDAFAWWVVARFSDPKNETRVVDASVECRAAGTQWRIDADVAREDGTVLAEYAVPAAANAESVGSGALVDDHLRRVTSFLAGQVECIAKELEQEALATSSVNAWAGAQAIFQKLADSKRTFSDSAELLREDRER